MMLPLFGLFGVVELVFLAIVVAAVLLAAFDRFWPLTLGVIVFTGIAALGWVAVPAFLWTLLHPLYIVGYLLIGIAWTFFKWTRLVDRYLRERRPMPTWAQHRYDFSAYFFYWPFDVVGYILSDLVRDVWNWISVRVGQVFDHYAEARYARHGGKR